MQIRMAGRSLSYNRRSPRVRAFSSCAHVKTRQMSTLEQKRDLEAAAERAAVFVSVVIPCLNEEQSIAQCIGDAKAALAEAGLHGEVVVVDNDSDDRSAELAELAGARVIHE